jgi:hypothetical protein
MSDIEHHYVGVDRWGGVRALWCKVIARAIYDWVSYRDSTKLPLRKYADDAYRWLFCESEVFNSFENLCYYLEINPDEVRERACRLDRTQVAKLELLDRMPAPLREQKRVTKLLQSISNRAAV